ncbi:hypothetical protein Droror1_Dr00022783 [Drosera rotundifolia]
MEKAPETAAPMKELETSLSDLSKSKGVDNDVGGDGGLRTRDGLRTPVKLKVPKAFKYPERYMSPTDHMISPVSKGILTRTRKTGGGVLSMPLQNSLATKINNVQAQDMKQLKLQLDECCV